MRHVAFGFLPLLSFLETAHAGGGMSGFGAAFLLGAVILVALYGLVTLCFITGILAWRKKKRRLGGVLIVLALLPFLHYSSVVLRSQFEPERRRQQLASLMKQRVAPAIPPRSMEAIGVPSYKWSGLAALVAAGVVEEVVLWRPRGKVVVYEPREGPECIFFEDWFGTGAELRRVVRARHAFRRCAKETTREGAANAPIQLLVDERAPNRYAGPACLGGGNWPLELRMAPDHGGGLVAFWESPSYVAHAFPPRFPGQDGWECKTIALNSPDHHTQDIFGFVATALGFKEAEDFPRSSKPQLVPETLQVLKERQAQNHILALLGQWPSTPAIEEALDDPHVAKHGDMIIRTAAALLTDPRNEERRKHLYPQLSTHLPSFLRICARRGNRFDTEEACSRLATAAKGIAPQPQR